MEQDASRSILDYVREAQQGSRDAYDALFECYRGHLSEYIVLRMGRRLQSWIECADIEQEVAVLGLRDIKKFQWRGPKSFYRWLSGIAEHAILRHAREARRQPCGLESAVMGVLQDRRTSPGTDMQRWERLARLKSAVERLSKDQRKVIILIYSLGLLMSEVAEKLGRSIDAIHMLHLRAIRKLRMHFGDTQSLHLPEIVHIGWEQSAAAFEPRSTGSGPSSSIRAERG